MNTFPYRQSENSKVAKIKDKQLVEKFFAARKERTYNNVRKLVFVVSNLVPHRIGSEIAKKTKTPEDLIPAAYTNKRV